MIDYFNLFVQFLGGATLIGIVFGLLSSLFFKKI